MADGWMRDHVPCQSANDGSREDCHFFKLRNVESRDRIDGGHGLFCLAAVATIAVVQKFWNVKSSVHSGRINDVCGRVGGGLRSERVAQNDLAFVELPVRDPLVVTAATRSTGLQVRSDLRDGPAPIIMSAVLRKLISKTGGNPGPECNRRLRTETRGSPRRTCGSSPRCGKRRCVCLDVRDPTSGAPAALNRACRKGHR
jgi:hypothetical protein